MARIIAIANQKGGVGKTTTAVNLAASLAISERKTLLVDADPQGNATSGVGVRKEQLRWALYDVLIEGRPSRTSSSTTHPSLPRHSAGDPGSRWRRIGAGGASPARGSDAPCARARAGLLRIHPHRLPALPRSHHAQRAGRRGWRPDSDPVRVLRPGGDLAAAQYHQARPAEFQRRISRSTVCCSRCTTRG